MSIIKVEAFPVRIKCDQRPTSGSLPKEAVDTQAYFRRPPYRALYSAYFETAFVKITTADGAIGWGEALGAGRAGSCEYDCGAVACAGSDWPRSFQWQCAVECDVRPDARARLLRWLYA